jgi:hypothetical protein
MRPDKRGVDVLLGQVFARGGMVQFGRQLAPVVPFPHHRTLLCTGGEPTCKHKFGSLLLDDNLELILFFAFGYGE